MKNNILFAIIFLSFSVSAEYDNYSETCDFPRWFDMDGPKGQCNPEDPTECFYFWTFNNKTGREMVKDPETGDWVDAENYIYPPLVGYTDPGYEPLSMDDINKPSGYHFDGPTDFKSLIKDAFEWGDTMDAISAILFMMTGFFLGIAYESIRILNKKEDKK